VVKTILLVALIGALANFDRRTSLRLMFSQPICTGFLTGIVMGLPMQGFMFGAILQMMILGVVSVRGSLVPEFEIGGVVGTALYLSALRFSAMDISVEGAIFFLAIAVTLLVSTCPLSCWGDYNLIVFTYLHACCKSCGGVAWG